MSSWRSCVTKTVIGYASLLMLAVSGCLGDPVDSSVRKPIQSESKITKMVWAHFVTWPIDFIEKFDDPQILWPRYSDRTLLGKWVNTRQGMEAVCGLQIDSARKYGIDGFAVDVPQSRHYVSSMERLYKSAEGTDFKIALCVDGWKYGDRNREQVAADLVNYFKKFGTHPNNCYVNGKPVVFVYQTGLSLADSRKIVEKVKEAGYEAYWIVQPQRETAGLWQDRTLLGENLEVFDGFYDFGVNGVPVEQMRERLQNGRKALDQKNPRGILVAGITPGYAGAHNGYYRPFHGTGTIRDNWQAALESNVDWICLTTWNDYTESTQFEPTMWGRDARLILNAEYVRQWRGESPQVRGPEVILSYKSEVRLGDEWTLEVTSLRYTTPKAFCHVRIQNLDGKIIQRFEPIELAQDRMLVETLRLKEPELSSLPVFQTWVSVTDSNAEPAKETWRCLYPVTISSGTVRDMKTLQLRFGQMLSVPTIEMAVVADSIQIAATLPDANPWVGSAELIRNGIVIAMQELPRKDKSQAVITFTAAKTVEEPWNLYTVRFNRADGRFALSRSFQLNQPAAPQDVVTVPVLTRNGDFDETWSTRFIPAAEIKTAQIDKSRVYGFKLPMDDGSTRQLRNDGGWPIVALGGGVFWGKVDEQSLPEVGEETLPNQTSLKFLKFDGHKTRVVLQPGALPFDVMTVEMRFRPKKQSEEAYLFSDANQAMAIGITSDGVIFMERGDLRLRSSQPVIYDAWNHVAAIYDGKNLAIYMNRKLSGIIEVTPTIRPLNSIIALGCKAKEGFRYSSYYAGAIAGVSVKAQPLLPDAFLLPLSEGMQP